MLLLNARYLKVRRDIIMLLPSEMKPEDSVYYYSAFVLDEIAKNANHDIISLFQAVKERMDISLKVFSYCLDWLYLIEAAQVDDNGWVKLCT